MAFEHDVQDPYEFVCCFGFKLMALKALDWNNYLDADGASKKKFKLCLISRARNYTKM